MFRAAHTRLTPACGPISPPDQEGVPSRTAQRSDRKADRQQAVNAVEHAAVPRYQPAAVLDAEMALDGGFEEVASLLDDCERGAQRHDDCRRRALHHKG